MFFHLWSFGILYVSGAVHGMMCVVDVSIPMAFLHSSAVPGAQGLVFITVYGTVGTKSSTDLELTS